MSALVGCMASAEIPVRTTFGFSNRPTPQTQLSIPPPALPIVPRGQGPPPAAALSACRGAIPAACRPWQALAGRKRLHLDLPWTAVLRVAGGLTHSQGG